MRRHTICTLSLCLFALVAAAQSDPDQLKPLLTRKIASPDVVGYQLRQYVMKRVPPLRVPASPEEWSAEAAIIRKHLLQDVVFHGWPKAWVNSEPRFVAAGVIETGKGYRIRKMRYEIVPGFESTALLYEPEKLTGRVPAILNVNGHVGFRGKAIEYKQKRCINFAKRGILALNLEWLGFGELTHKENDHAYAAHLDLAGANGVGLFYLAMRRGLDYLEKHPHADPARLGVTGLSGGGWQTITLSSLDERVAVAVPVAGFSSLASSAEHPEYIGNDIEQNATDFRDGQDYTHLAAMRAPRPTLLIYNAEDDCCFIGPLVKHQVYDEVVPFFRLFGAEKSFAYYENADPGTHNYQLDNRIQAYRFFGKHFKIPELTDEMRVESEVRTYKELEVGLPRENLTILGLARKIAAMNERAPETSAAAARERLSQVVRYRPISVKHPWGTASTKSKGVETCSYQLQFSDDLSAAGLWLKAMAGQAASPAAIVLHDIGRRSTASEVSDAVNRGEQVLALDVLFTNDMVPTNPGIPEFAQLLAAIGDRPLGLEAAQVIAAAKWLKESKHAPAVRLEATGIRSQVIALVAAAIEPGLFSEITVRGGMRSLKHLLNVPIHYESAPDLFCLDLYKEFDIERLARLASPSKVDQAFLPGSGK